MEELQIAKGPWDPAEVTTPTNPEAPSRKEIEFLIDPNIGRDTKNLEGVMKNAVEENFMESMKFVLNEVEDNRKYGIYILKKNVVAEVFKGDHIQAIIGRLTERAVTK